MFGELVAAYLFLAGVGAGGIVAASLADLTVARASFEDPAPRGFAEAPPAQRLVALVLAASVAALGIGATCLMFDLGRIDRVLMLFASPSLTLMNVGAWALAALLVVGLFLALIRFLDIPGLRRSVVAALEVIALVLAVVVAVYAGLLLQALAGVRLWSLGWVPVLFVLSAASCGCALVMGAAVFAGDDPMARSLVRRALVIDGGVVLVEMAVAALFVGTVLVSDHPGMRASAASLLDGAAALPWWAGFVLCGLVLPAAAEMALILRERRARATSSAMPAMALLAVAILVLAGGAGLRWAVVDAGAHRPLELQVPLETVALSGISSPSFPSPSTESEVGPSWSH